MSLHVQTDVSLKEFNTFGLFAKASHYVYVEKLEQLQAIFSNPQLRQMPRVILGGGSNMLMTKDIQGLVLHMGLKGKEIIKRDDAFSYVKAAGGENWHEFVLWTLQNEVYGLENLSLIPGTVGAAPVQNIGAYGSEVKEMIESVEVFDFQEGSFRTFSQKECAFSYRDSFFKRDRASRYVIVSVLFKFPKNWKANLSYAEVKKAFSLNQDISAQAISQAIISIRQEKLPDPKVFGNAGSFFKNPTVSQETYEQLKITYPQMPAYEQANNEYRLAAGWLIDQCGWKGKRLGQAGVSPKQALILVNLGQATGKDILELSQKIQSDVKTKFGIELEVEPVFI